MNFFNQLTTAGKAVVIGLAVAILVGGAIWFHSYSQKHGILDKAGEKLADSKFKVNSDADIVIAYNTFPGMEGILLMNNGMEPNTECQLYKDYGIKLQIKKMDVVGDTRDGLVAGVLDAVYCTTDAQSIEMGSGSRLLDLKVKNIFKINESRGADAIVATKGVKTIADLKGKKIAYAVGTASNTLLINTLETSGLKSSDIEAYKVADGVEAANAFKAGQCDAAVVWAPDDEDCVAAIAGSKVLVSTSTATQIIADGLLVTQSNLDAKRDKLTKLIAAWMKGNALINNSTTSRNEANTLFAKYFDFPIEIAAISSTKIRFCTLEDNKNFFGLDPTYTGVTGEKMYSRMAVKYTEAGLAKAPAPWQNVSDASIIQSLLNTPLANESNQKSEAAITFAAPTSKDLTVQAKGTKQITLNFSTGIFNLDDQNKTVIDREITGLAQAFEGARIRVEGNTDNVGNTSSNKILSKQRAQAVVDYLVTEYKFDRNKFIIVGNGPDKPVSDNTTEEGKALNRRTDVNFIW